MRELAGYDPARYAQIYKHTTLAEGLLAYEQRLRDDARREYELAVLCWCALNSSGMGKRKKPPALPAILKEC